MTGYPVPSPHEFMAQGSLPLIDPAEYMRRAPVPPGGNTPWASAYSYELQQVIKRQANRSPRNVQTTLGPSELGSPCDLEVVSKFAGAAPTNHIIDPWPSIVGTAVHAWLADAFAKENVIDGFPHWFTEMRVSPHPAHPGTTDLYDSVTYSCVDWKVLGPTTLAKISSAEGPPRRYVVQLLLYAMGCRLAGYRVDRVVLAALPRAAPTMSQMYVWERVHTPEDDLLVSQVLAETELRWRLAQGVLSRQIDISEIPWTPNDACKWCRQFRPEVAREIREGREPGPGCPGNSPLS